ncbi:type VI secretion system membrane subunit TssM [Dickeya solani]|uniref:Type VI secretion system membrane subunit TssM n=2 Tax=Dickeya solani TaxID=1089444 RepID=A0ABU4EBT5_9GAMM|nr:type VI secretion system membrane subunit TssM [Dickeya solani]ANE76705.1 type VI secretion protein IcmF [Dickeya solani IPO 2222]AUC44372.1 IcmF-related protein [Dickeya solani RNS 08.23.3.1.A]AUH07883.1 type VI secretion protein IcmF [Dickeya solani D s0432-1]AUH11906.1 type VI secretion protein IcmF [Dickeya solani]AYQ47219.1 Intracellular multiplication macrophage-killing protein [Dickeya solani]
MLKIIITFLRQQLPKLKPSWLLLGVVVWVVALVLAWWLGPRLTLGDMRPLQSVWGRVVFTLVWLWLGFAYSAWHVWRRVQQLRAERREQQIIEQDPLQVYVDSQQTFLDRWLQAFQTQLGKKALYAMPWYLAIGLSGSGKSSLIHRANTANKLNPKLDAELRDVAGGQQVNSWVGESAVIWDPSGQLLAQPEIGAEPSAGRHARLWQHLLQWLSLNRRRQPLNGLVLTIDLSWLAQASVSERKAYAQVMRARLQEIAVNINTRLPLYVALTRLDMLRGFDVVYRSLNREARQAVLGVTFTPQASHGKGWLEELERFWDDWIANLNNNLPEMLLTQSDRGVRNTLFTFVRQLAGLKDYVTEVLNETLATGDDRAFLVRGVYVSSVYQQGVPFDAFAQSASRRYQLPEPINAAMRGESNTFFVQKLFPEVIFPEASLAGENRLHSLYRRRRMSIGITCMVLFGLAMIGSWHHFYRVNEEAGRNVLTKAQAFIGTNELEGQAGYGYQQLPRLNLIRDATLSFGNYHERTPMLADLGLYQGDKIGPYVEGSYLQMLNQRFLPAVMQGLLEDLNQAPAGSEQKLTILRVMRMLDDASGRNKTLVEQFMALRWQKAFPGQGKVQEQLMQHLDYALDHTDWHQSREQKDTVAISTFAPFVDPIASAQRELSKLPMYQRVYQSLVMKATQVLPPDLAIRDEVGPTFDSVFTLRNDKAGTVPRLLTYPGFSDFYLKQDKTLLDLTALDAWVLGQRERAHLSEADRKEILRQVNDRYITDYINQWQKALANIDVQPLESPEQALNILTDITGNDQPFQRVLTTVSDNTRIRKLADDENDTAQGINTRIGRPFMTINAALSGRGEQGPLVQEVNQKLTDLYHYLDQIVNATDPGQAALKAVQARQGNKFADPVFALQQYARSLPAPLDRWVGQLAGESASLVTGLAMSSLNQEWMDKVVTPFNEKLADRYPFNPSSDKDVPLSEMERFFAVGGTLDSFYQTNLKSIMDSGMLEGEGASPLQTELVKQLDRATRIRQTLFNAQGSLEIHFVVEPVELTANKRRSVLNLDGQLLEYSHGRRTKTPLVWPNSMRDGAESKLTLVPDDRERSPRSLSFTGPWAMFRLLTNGQLTQVNDNTFDVRFSLEQGGMTYRVYTDASHNPFAGGLFSQFKLPDSLY